MIEMTRKMVIPGELVAEGDYFLGDGVYKSGNEIYSSIMGLLDERGKKIRVIPFKGKYMPKEGDFVIGTVIDSPFPNAWEIEIMSPYFSILNASDYFREIDVFKTPILEIMKPGEMIYAYIREVSPTRRVFLTMTERGARRLGPGKIIEISPSKIPRVIGKKRSMLSMIVKETGTNILVGQNGRIWIRGKPEMVEFVTKVIMRIEQEAHTPGLTDKIKQMVNNERNNL